MPSATGLRRMSLRTRWATLEVLCDAHGTVVGSWFSGLRAPAANAVSGPVPPRFAEAHAQARSVRSIATVADAVRDWCDGDVDAILRVPVEQPGGDFQRRAWQAMRRVRGGTVGSYAELARMAGRPRAVRAAGTACAVNAVPPFVPCHRIVRSDGSLGNYAYGRDLKAALLAHEGVIVDD